MFALDIYKPMKKNASDQELIRISKIFGTIIALVSFFISPMLMNAPDGLWDLIRRFTGFFNIPIITIVLVGLLSKRIPALAAKVVIGFHVITYYMLVWGLNQLFGVQVTINFIYVYAILFCIEVAIMLVIGKMKPMKVPYIFKSNAQVSLKPWKYSLLVTVILLTLIVMTYIVFSPIGLAYGTSIVSPLFWPAMIAVTVIAVILGYLSMNSWNKKYAHYLEKQQNKEIAKNHKKLA
jgi:SSS family solute:Na+ symporter